MAVDPVAVLDAIESFAQRSGYFAEVHRGEPKSPAAAGDRLSAAVFYSGAKNVVMMLNRPVELHVVMLRIYENMLNEPEGDIETNVVRVAGQFKDDIERAVALGGAIRNVDAGGIHGDSLGWTMGHVELGGTFYRIADVLIPLVVDGTVDMAR